MTQRHFELRKPLLNTGGSLGFTPNARGPIALNALGAFVTNPISARRRRAAQDAGQAALPEGALLHSGWPNPGLSRSLGRYAARWARAELPIIVHLLGEDPARLRRMVARVEELENVIAIEVGIPPDSSPELVADLSRAAVGELPVIAQLPFERAGELAAAALDVGSTAVSLAAPRASIPQADGTVFSGRLYGPKLFPGALKLVEELVGQGAPVIGGGGVYSAEQAQAMLDAGAMAVMVDTLLWRAGARIEDWELDKSNQ